MIRTHFLELIQSQKQKMSKADKPDSPLELIQSQKQKMSKTDKPDSLCLIDHLDCCICMTLFKEPKQLACGHIFCEQCILSLMKSAATAIPAAKNARNVKVSCPTCRKLLSLPKKNDLTTNYTIKGMVEKAKQAQAAAVEAARQMSECISCLQLVPSKQLFRCITCPIPSTNKQQIFCPLCVIKKHNGHELIEENKLASNSLVQKYVALAGLVKRDLEDLPKVSEEKVRQIQKSQRCLKALLADYVKINSKRVETVEKSIKNVSIKYQLKSCVEEEQSTLDAMRKQINLEKNNFNNLVSDVSESIKGLSSTLTNAIVQAKEKESIVSKATLPEKESIVSKATLPEKESSVSKATLPEISNCPEVKRKKLD